MVSRSMSMLIFFFFFVGESCRQTGSAYLYNRFSFDQ